MPTNERTYLVEHFVRSNLRSHNGKAFAFEVSGAKVTISPARGDASVDGVVVQTALQSDAILLAERAAHDAVTELFDILCFEMRVTGLVVDLQRSQVEGEGVVRRCMVYLRQRRQSSLFIMDPQAAEIRRILATAADTNIRRALYWLRWTYNARTIPEAFLFAWMAIERLTGEQESVSRCGCGAPVTCPTHGEHRYSSVPRHAINALLERHGITGMETLIKLRNPLVHGSLEHKLHAAS